MNIFKGLETFGLKQPKSVELYSEGEHIDTEYRVIVEREALYDKSYVCPVCQKKFKNRAVKTSRQRIMSIEYDLRPTYDYFETYKYDVILCPHCGYAALDSVYSKITPIQAKVIEQKIGAQFRSTSVTGDIYDYETSILRYKLALYVAVLKNANSIEKAYLCLRLKWLFQVCIESMEDGNEQKAVYKQQIISITEQALTGFLDTYMKGHYSSFGFDESKLMYIIGQLSSELEKNKEAYEWLTKVASYTGANFRLRDMARDRRAEIKRKL